MENHGLGVWLGDDGSSHYSEWMWFFFMCFIWRQTIYAIHVHYYDVNWASLNLYSSITRTVCDQLTQADIKAPFVSGMNPLEPGDSPHKRPILRKMLPCHDVIYLIEIRRTKNLRSIDSNSNVSYGMKRYLGSFRNHQRIFHGIRWIILIAGQQQLSRKP